jgi:hypothetical protein
LIAVAGLPLIAIDRHELPLNALLSEHMCPQGEPPMIAIDCN